ncbi:metallophosphoesterase [Kitasatospora sp. NPDC059088]|uniref:metallophosphoesterase n=1 Tax=Kitasatospora sp. NPDC059088 TaxID=3346722 RepID=UPI0036A46B3A
MSARPLTGVTASTDVHSNLQLAQPLLAHLHRARADHLVVDCGDWFEGTGFYQLGGGTVERQILTRLYDVVAPGNHGFRHYLTDPKLHRITVCANVLDADARPVFRTIHRATISSRRVAVTGIMGPEAFDAVRIDQRPGLQLADPATTLRDLAACTPDVDDWVLLSHSGFEHDLALAADCPHLGLVFSGHCHTGQRNPTPAGRALVVKGAERAHGYAEAHLGADGSWSAGHAIYPSSAAPNALSDLTTRIDQLARRLAEPIGTIARPWAGTTPERHALLTAVTRHLHHQHHLPVVLADSTLRPAPLGTTLALGDLLALEPYANRLVVAEAPSDLAAWLERISAPELAGPLATWPLAPAETGPQHVLTSDYIADTFTTGHQKPTGQLVADAVRTVLTHLPRSCAHPAPRTAAPVRD